ncbi:MAG: DUF711 family protein [Candidatus Solibacter sp.]
MRKILLLALLSIPFALGQAKPKVRAITAFIRIDAAHLDAQIAETVQFLNAARDEYKASGFEVETIRVVTQPLANYTKGIKRADALALLKHYSELAIKHSFTPNLGAIRLTDDDESGPVDLAIDAFSTLKINGSMIVAAENGIHWKSIREAARLVKAVAARSPHGEGNLNFATAAMIKPYTPFYPAAWHDGPGKTFAVGLESANVVAEIFSQVHEPGPAESKLAAALTTHLMRAEAAAVRIAASSKWAYAGIDPTPAPLGEVSIGRAFENYLGAPFGSAGTMTVAGIITRAVQSTPVKQVGYSGLMVPVLEDAVLLKRWEQRTYNIDSLLAYSAVCAGGLDTIPLRGDTSEATLARIMGDVASLAFKWRKPLAARLLPAPGKGSGDRTEFSDDRMANTIIH